MTSGGTPARPSQSPLAAPLLHRLSELVAARLGLLFRPERWADLERGLRAAAPEFGFEDPAACIEWLTTTPRTRDQLEVLASHLTVGETYFFRERQTLAVLETQILPALIQSRRAAPAAPRLRLWSAGCCTGEEPYTLAMLLSQLLPDLEVWDVTILATDINPQFLQKAMTGVYSAWSFRDTPPALKERHFRRQPDGRYEIVSHIKQMVRFAPLNLAEANFPSLHNNTADMDVILCRNVLMYLTPELIKTIVVNFYQALAETGWLIVSPSESSHVVFSQFATVNFPGTILYQKQAARGDGSRRESAAVHTGAVKAAAQTNTSTRRAVVSPSRSAPSPARLETQCVKRSKRHDDLDRARQEKAPEINSTGQLYEQGVALLEQYRYAEAAAKLSQWLAVAPPGAPANAPACVGLARTYANLGQLEKALEWCARAMEADRLNPTSYYLHAIILQEQGAVEAATEALKRVLYIDPDFLLAHFALGNLARRQNKPTEAQKHFANALQLLSGYRPDAIVPESEHITAARLADVITAMTG